MKVFYSAKHSLHNPKGEIDDGKFVPPYEGPERAYRIIDETGKRNLGDRI
jgi:hypothetical protein